MTQVSALLNMNRKRKWKQHSNTSITENSHVNTNKRLHHEAPPPPHHHPRLHRTIKGVNRLYEAMQIAHLPKYLKEKHCSRYYLRVSGDNVNDTNKIDRHTLHLLVKAHIHRVQQQRQTNKAEWTVIAIRVRQRKNSNVLLLHMHLAAIMMKNIIQATTMMQIKHTWLLGMMPPWNVY